MDALLLCDVMCGVCPYHLSENVTPSGCRIPHIRRVDPSVYRDDTATRQHAPKSLSQTLQERVSLGTGLNADISIRDQMVVCPSSSLSLSVCMYECMYTNA